MPKISVASVEKWITQGERLVKSPIGGLLWKLIEPRLPKAGFTEAQIAGMKARYDEATAREARARQRATK